MSVKLITNQKTTLSDIINDTLPRTSDIRFLVGYFYYSGFKELYTGLNDKKLKILVGLDIEIDIMNSISEVEKFDYKRVSKSSDQRDYWDKLVKLFNKTNKLDTAEAQDSFRLFCEKVKNGTLEIRKTKEPNHAKMYLFEAEDTFGGTLPGHMIIGSSNLSGSGLRSQNELNVFFHGEEYNQGKEYFDILWDVATPIADLDTWTEFEKNVVEKIWVDKLPSPYLIYLRVLDEYFKTSNIDSSFMSPFQITEKNDGEILHVYKDLAYQTDAIKEGLDRIERHTGVIIADVVGLGKSVIASAIASNLDMPVVVIAPPHLQNQWEDYCKEFHIFHRSKIYSSGKIETAVNDFASYDQQILIIIDEAHKYRNKNTDYMNLHQLCQGNKVLLLTATPYNNRPDDIYNLLRLFQIPGKTTLKNIDNLGAQFEDLISKYNKAYKEAKNNKKNQHLQDRFDEIVKAIAKRITNIIAPIVIRRSRKDLLANTKYKKDLKAQGIEFSKVNDPKVLEYNLGDMEDKYIKTLDAIYPKNFDEESESKPIQDGVYKASRYQPLKYAKEESKDVIIRQMADEDIEWEFLEGSQINLANFMRRLLVHRFESSIASFQKSLESLIHNSKNILDWINVRNKVPVFKRGFLPDINSIMESSDDNDMFGGVDKIEAEVARFKEKGLIELDINYIKTEFINDIKNDIEILESIYNDWFGADGKIKNDPKFDNFVKQVKDMLVNDPERKIILFSEFADTIEYIEERLKEEGLPVFGYSSRKASEASKKIIKENFDAGIPSNMQKDYYKILVATDAISEGYNLHRAGTIFNYDIPYNPTRVIQRIGRINRVNKKVFEELYIYNYFPSLVGEQNVAVKQISTIKMRMIHAIMGGDTKILEGDEELSLSNFNNQFREAKDANDQESWETKFRDEWEQAKNTPEFQEALEIHQRTRIKRTETRGKPGVIVFGKRGDDCVFKWAIESESAPEPMFPEDALPLFKANKDEKSVKESSLFEPLYQHIKNNLFSGTPSVVSSPRGKAMNKIKAMQADVDNAKHLNYIEMLLNVLEIDGLPDFSKINKAKTISELQKKISSEYLERILKSAELVDHEPENVILSEEQI